MCWNESDLINQKALFSLQSRQAQGHLVCHLRKPEAQATTRVKGYGTY
jgi:hypothetical protein